MPYQPVVPLSGIGGWAFLERTRDAQEAAFRQSSEIVRDTDYFLANIGNVSSAEDLVNDRRLLRVALGAYGLDEDIDAKAYVRTVLEEGTISEDALANRLSDQRYYSMAKAFAFDLTPPNTARASFAADVVELFQSRQFEVGVGNASTDMRLALEMDREITALADRDISNEAKWFTMLGTSSMRVVFERAFGLPTEVGALEIDKQFEIFQQKSEAFFGTTDFSSFGTEEGLEELRTQFLARSELLAGIQPTTRGAAALALLQGPIVDTGPTITPLTLP